MTYPLDDKSQALLKIGQSLRSKKYHFITITPESHRRVISRSTKRVATLADIFGWNLDFDPSQIDPAMIKLLEVSDSLTRLETGRFRSNIRFSTLGNEIYLHSGFPTDEKESVFFGPDTYRFVRFVRQQLKEKVSRALDIGVGSGAGGIALLNHCSELCLSDLSELALQYTDINLRLNGITPQEKTHLPKIQVLQSDLYNHIEGKFDLVIANPPFIADERQRTYRNGGGNLGLEMSQRIVEQTLPRLSPGGKLLLYTGVPIVQGLDPLRDFLTQVDERFKVSYEEIDPDIFGEELSLPQYETVERIAAVGLVIQSV